MHLSRATVHIGRRCVSRNRSSDGGRDRHRAALVDQGLVAGCLILDSELAVLDRQLTIVDAVVDGEDRTVWTGKLAASVVGTVVGVVVGDPHTVRERDTRRRYAGESSDRRHAG